MSSSFNYLSSSIHAFLRVRPMVYQRQSNPFGAPTARVVYIMRSTSFVIKLPTNKVHLVCLIQIVYANENDAIRRCCCYVR